MTDQYTMEIADDGKVIHFLNGNPIDLVNIKEIEVGDTIHFLSGSETRQGKVEKIGEIGYSTVFVIEDGFVVSDFEILLFEKTPKE